MKTPEEKRAYQRGYNAGRRSTHGHAEKCLVIAKGYRERSIRPDDKRACVDCSRWTRGAPSRAIWGTCAASFEYGVEARMWSDVDDSKGVITTEDFSCPNFLPKTMP